MSSISEFSRFLVKTRKHVLGIHFKDESLNPFPKGFSHLKVIDSPVTPSSHHHFLSDSDTVFPFH